MKHLNFGSLNSIKNKDFPNLFNQWKDYSTNSVALLYLEMKRRNISLTEENQKSFQDFLLENNFSESEMINNFNKENNVNSYIELYKIATTPTVESDAQKKMRILQSHQNSELERKNGTNDIIFGGLIFAVGCIITLATLSSGSGFITYGAIIFGFIKMMRGVLRT